MKLSQNYKGIRQQMVDKLMEKIIKMCKSEPNLEIKFPVLMRGLNETDDEYRKRIIEYVEKQNDR